MRRTAYKTYIKLNLVTVQTPIYIIFLIKSKISAIGKLDSINVSMDSYDSETFYKYRKGTQKQFDQIIDGLEILNKKGIKFSLSYILSKENLHEAPKMIDFSEKMKADIVHFHNINPHGSDQFSTLMIQDENTIQFQNAIDFLSVNILI